MIDGKLAALIRRVAGDSARSAPKVKVARVTAVSAGRVTVEGRRLRYVDSYVSPAVGDRVVVSTGATPVVLGRLV